MHFNGNYFGRQDHFERMIEDWIHGSQRKDNIRGSLKTLAAFRLGARAWCPRTILDGY